MFISKSEKEQLQKDIKNLASLVQDINAEVIYLRALIKADKAPKEAKKGRKKAVWTPEQRAKQSAFMKARHEKQRQQKLSAVGVI
jgi:hypothetical protein